MSRSALAIAKHFHSLPDPRVAGRRKHLLTDIVVITICGVIGGCNDWPQIVTFARARQDWVKRYLRLANGVPSEDNFDRVFDRLEPAPVPSGFRSCMHDPYPAAELSPG